MYCLFLFTSSCQQEGSCIVCSSLPPVVSRRAHVLFVSLYLQLLVGGLMYCLFLFTPSCQQEGSCIVCSSLPPVVSRRAHGLLALFVFAYVQWCSVWRINLVFLCLVYPMLPVLIAPSFLPNVYLSITTFYTCLMYVHYDFYSEVQGVLQTEVVKRKCKQ